MKYAENEEIKIVCVDDIMYVVELHYNKCINKCVYTFMYMNEEILVEILYGEFGGGKGEKWWNAVVVDYLQRFFFHMHSHILSCLSSWTW